MSDYIKPSYPKWMRERATRDQLHLVTVDTPGMCFQGTVDRAEVKMLMEAIVRLCKAYQEHDE